MVEPEVVDLGVLRPDQDARFEFAIVNRDSRPLRISHVHGSCDCLGYVWDRSEVPAGGRRLVSTNVRAENRGNKLLTVDVRANDREGTMRQVSIRYVVMPDLVFKPHRADFGKRVAGSPSTLEVEVAYQLPRDVEPIALAPSLAAPAPVRVREAAAPLVIERPGGLKDVTHRLALELDVAAPSPSFDTHLVFASDRHRPARLPVTGEVHRGYYLDPDHLHLGVADVGATRRGSVRLLWTRDEPKIEAIDCEPSGLEAQAVAETGSRSYRIQVTFEARSKGDLDGAVRIRTNLDSDPLLLRVKGKVR